MVPVVRTNLTAAPIKNADMTNPNEADRDMLNGRQPIYTADPWEQGKRHKGFQLSAETKKEIASESSFNRMQRVMADANRKGIELYANVPFFKQVTFWQNEDGEEVDSDDESAEVMRSRVECFYKPRFLTMQENIRRLARQRGSVASDAKDILINCYREGWRDAVHVKYGEQTEAQKSRRESGGLLSWQAQTEIKNSFSGDAAIALQLSIPELRWLRGNQVQREAALSQVRWAIHCLFWCAYEARKANPGFKWGETDELDIEINVPIDSQTHWDDAVAAMHLYMRMATRFCDANERKLVIKAVIWEIYWNPNHLPVMEYLEYLSQTTEEDSKLNDFLHAFNAAEMLGIKQKAANAWHKARAFFLGGGAIRGLNTDSNYSTPSLNAIANFTAWWRRFAARAKARAEVNVHFLDMPEDMRKMMAEDIYGAKSWEDLEDWQRETITRDWAKGQEAHKEWVTELAEKNAAEEVRKAELADAASKDAERRAMAAFPKPASLEAFADAEYREHNSDFKKKQDVAAKRKADRAIASKGKKAPKKRRVTTPKPQSVAASPAGPSAAVVDSSSDEDSLFDSDDSSDESAAAKVAMRKPSRKKVVYTSDEDSDSD